MGEFMDQSVGAERGRFYPIHFISTNSSPIIVISHSLVSPLLWQSAHGDVQSEDNHVCVYSSYHLQESSLK